MFKRILLAAALALPMTAGIVHTARAGTHDTWSVYGGIVGANAGITTSGSLDGPQVNAEVRLPVISAFDWFGSPRPTFGSTLATRGSQINTAYAAMTFTLWRYERIALEGQLGGAIHDADLKGDSSGRRLGSHVLFYLGLDVDWRLDEDWSLQLFANHMSNANLASHNAGLETAGVRVGYHF